MPDRKYRIVFEYILLSFGHCQALFIKMGSQPFCLHKSTFYISPHGIFLSAYFVVLENAPCKTSFPDSVESFIRPGYYIFIAYVFIFGKRHYYIMTGKISYLKEVKYQIFLHMRLEECFVKVEEKVITFVENVSFCRKGSTELSPCVQHRLCT